MGVSENETKVLDNSIESLHECAVHVLNTADVYEKARLTLEYSSWWKSLDAKASSVKGNTAVIVAYPARPVFQEQNNNPIVEKSKCSSKVAKFIHGVCHAESVAIDLMWDLIHRFHDEEMPIDFYNDWVRIAAEEAQHFTSWATRFHDLTGQTYGVYPTHDSLWQSALDTKDSLLARLAIVHGVHEARGLDVYPKAAERLDHAKDTISRAIIDKNHREEITHVAAAVKWFKYLCRDDTTSETTTYHNLVKKHFSGQLRPPFNKSARLQAGMGEEWYLPLVDKK